MEQKLAELNSEEMSGLLKKSLVEQAMISSELMEEIVSERDNAIDSAKKSIQATCYAVDYKAKKLNVFDTYTNETFASVDLPGGKFKFNIDEFDSWGTSTVIVDLEEMQKEGDIVSKLEGIYGLAVREGNAYLYNQDLDKQSLLALTNQFIFGGNSKNKGSNLPYDMYFAPDYSFLCLSNRDEGKVYLFDTKTNTFTGDISVRAAGSHKTINIAISTKSNKIYLTDSATPNITIYEIATKKSTKKSLGNGILGNICLTEAQDTLYAVITKPEPNLKAFKVDSFEEIKAFPPKGEFFSLGDDPCDLLTLSADKKSIFSMTYLNEPIPFTPVLTVIDIEKKKAIKRFSIKDETKPINIAFKDINPIGPLNKTLEELLVEKGLFTFNRLRNIKMTIMNALKEGEDVSKLKMTAEGEEEKKEENILEVEQQTLEFEGIKEEKPQENVGLVPKKTKHVIIPLTANKQIMDVLLGSFWQKNELDLSESKEAEAKLMKVCDSVRRKLEYYDLEIVNMKNFYEECDLEGIIQRDFILEMLHEEESIKRQQVKSAPSNCMNCSAPMYGAWECPVCGFTYERPEDALRRKSASLDPLANLQKGHFFVLDSENGILMEVDNYKIPIWHVSKEEIDALSISQAYRLDNKNTLILDKEGNTLIEVSPKGRIVWRYHSEEENSLFNQPSGYSYLEEGNMLVADTENHRVMEMDLDGNIVWQYGVKGAAGIEYNSLNLPTDFQKTYDETFLIADSGNNRILELERKLNVETGEYELKVLWEYGNVDKVLSGGEGNGTNQLNRPISAFRELDGKTLILDAGNKRLIQVDSRLDLLWEYGTESNDEVNNISNPTRFTKLKNKDLLIIGDGKLVEVFPEGNKVVWTVDMETLSTKSTYRVVKENVKKMKSKYGKSGYMGKFGKAKHEEITEKKQEKKKVNASRYMKKGESPEDEKAKQLETIMEESKKAKDTKKEEVPYAILAENAEVITLPVISIDKGDQQILLLNRKAEVLWSYQEKKNPLFRPLYVEVTADKSLLVTDSSRVFEMDMKSKKIVWEHPCHARSAVKLKNGNILIPDERESKVIEVNRKNQVVWEYNCDKPPFHALRLSNNNTLVTHSMGHIVREVNFEGDVLWSFGIFEMAGDDQLHLSYPEHAVRLKNGNTLITDTGNSRIVEVNFEGDMIWSYSGDKTNILLSPVLATRLKDGHTYIIHSNYKQVLEVNEEKQMLWKLVLPSKRGMR